MRSESPIRARAPLLLAAASLLGQMLVPACVRREPRSAMRHRPRPSAGTFGAADAGDDRSALKERGIPDIQVTALTNELVTRDRLLVAL